MSLPHHSLPIEIELGMPSRCIFIATTICQRRSLPSPSTSTTCTRVDLAPSPRPMPHRSSCRAKLGSENSILARQQGSAGGGGGPGSGLSVVHRGSRPALPARWLAGREVINRFTWLAMTRFPAALRNLVKLERRRGVALVISRRARNPRRPPNASCRAVTR